MLIKKIFNFVKKLLRKICIGWADLGCLPAPNSGPSFDCRPCQMSQTHPDPQICNLGDPPVQMRTCESPWRVAGIEYLVDDTRR